MWLEVIEEVKSSNSLWKVSPILEKFRDTCLTLPRPRKVCTDKQIIPFSEIIRAWEAIYAVGMKSFVSTSPYGLVLDFSSIKDRKVARWET